MQSADLTRDAIKILGIYFSYIMNLMNQKNYCQVITNIQNNLSARTTLMNELNNISNAINSLNSTDLIRVILYGDKNFDNVTNFKIITATIKFIKTTKRFEEALS